MEKNKKTVLVTGSAGFLGTNLVVELLQKRNRVIGIDNFFSSSSEKNDLFRNNSDFLFIKHDIRQKLNIGEKIDEIYNLASPASPQLCRKDPIFTLETNITGTKNMLDLARINKAKFLQASTSEVYGDPLEHPQKESYRGNVNTLGPRSCYDEGKRVAETYCYEYFTQGVDVKIVRIFNTYGPYFNPQDGRVIVNFILQALRNEDLTVYGKGDQTRSFCYLSDLLRGIIKYMELKEKFLGPINLGNPDEFTILELAQMVLKLIPQTKSKIIFSPLPKDDPTRRKPDISLAKEILDWKPGVSLEEGLKRTIEYFLEWHRSYNSSVLTVI